MVRRLRWPVKINSFGTGFDTVEQESSQEILAAAENVLRTTQGGRAARPEYGVPDSLFTLTGPEPEPFERAVEDWEPRAKVSVDVSELEGMISRVRAEISA